MTDLFKYALVAHGTVIISDYQPITQISTCRSISQKILEQIDPCQERTSGEQGTYTYEALTEPDRMVYLCITSKDCIARLRDEFCDKLKQKWRAKFGNRGSTMSAFSQVKSFAPIFEILFGTFNSERVLKMAQIKDNAQKIQDQTAIDLKLALDRGDQIEIMSVKADQIKDSAKTFHHEISKVRSAMCWQKYRCYLFIGIIAIIILFIIIMFACGGPSFKKCK